MVCMTHRLQCKTLHFPKHIFPIHATRSTVCICNGCSVWLVLLTGKSHVVFIAIMGGLMCHTIVILLLY